MPLTRLRRGGEISGIEATVHLIYVMSVAAPHQTMPEKALTDEMSGRGRPDATTRGGTRKTSGRPRGPMQPRPRMRPVATKPAVGMSAAVT